MVAGALRISEVHRLSVDDYHRMIAAGVFDESDRVELLDGVLVAMSPQTALHAFVIRQVNKWLRSLSADYVVSVQSPLTLGDSEPEPDVAVCRAEEASLPDRHPQAAVFVVEVANESLHRDRSVKAAIYARAGVNEYWIVNLREQCIEIHRRPSIDAARFDEKLQVPARDKVAPQGLEVPPISYEDLTSA